MPLTLPLQLPLDWLARARIEIVGLAQDFWKDGGQPDATAKHNPISSQLHSPLVSEELLKAQDEAFEEEKFEKGRWKADRVRVKEKIWGNENIQPFNKDISDILINPLGLTKEMSVLDLSAGLGGIARIIARDFKSYVTGLEQDQEIAERGMRQSIAMGLAKRAEIIPYDPKTFVPDRRYDCIIMREMFYRIKDKGPFLKTVMSCLKKGGQVSMTDYCVDAKDKKNAAVTAWLKFEEGAAPVSSEDLAKVMGKMGLDVRTSEDLTDLYLKEMLLRLKAFCQYIAEHPPEETTRPLVVHEVEKWAQRAAALQQGLKFCRFYALRH